MIKTLKNHFSENKPEWAVMVISALVLIAFFNNSWETILLIFLTWTFCVSSHKIFIQDFVTKNE